MLEIQSPIINRTLAIMPILQQKVCFCFFHSFISLPGTLTTSSHLITMQRGGYKPSLHLSRLEGALLAKGTAEEFSRGLALAAPGALAKVFQLVMLVLIQKNTFNNHK